MLTTIALLMIGLGLIISLARDVRAQSAERLTKDLLRKLDRLMAAYSDANRGSLPAVTPLLPETFDQPLPPDPTGRREEQLRKLKEAAAQQNASPNNQQVMQLLRSFEGPSGKTFGGLPISIYDEKTHNLRDAWGNPIVFMPRMHPDVGMSPDRQFFFFSAGPDRQFLTRADNLYSYEVGQ